MRRDSEQGLEEQALFGDAGASVFTPGKRFRINIIAIFLNVFLPWIYFTWLLNITSFRFHWKKQSESYIDDVEDVWFWVYPIIVLVQIVIAVLVWKYRTLYGPNWYKVSFVQFLVAGWLACNKGEFIYQTFVENYMDWETLKIYPAINPSKEMGQNLMDAGTVYFTDGTAVDTLQSWHFTSDQKHHGIHRYCVAPISAGGPNEQGSYDFWAVGRDCCARDAPDFRCGDFKDGDARSGLRSMSGKDRPMYKLAVKQACAVFGIESKHPLFFEYIKDPLAKVEAWKSDGNDWYMHWIGNFFALNTIAVAVLTFVFAWIGRT